MKETHHKNQSSLGEFMYAENKGRRKMQLFGEMKLMGDAYAGGFSCGLTMENSGTMEEFSMYSEKEGELCYQSADGIFLIVHYEKDGEAVRTWTEVVNGSNKEISIEMLSSFAIKNVEADKIHRLQSFWSAEGKLRTESVEDLHLEKSWNGCGIRIEKFGNTGSMPVRKYFPFLVLENSCTGKFIGIQLYCASSWQMEISCRESQLFTVTGGIADRDFGHWCKKMLPGETFVAPEAVIAEGTSFLEVCARLVEAQHPLISEIDYKMGITFNEFCTTWGNPSFENIKRIVDKLEGKGIQYLVIDCGWFGKNEGWWRGAGDWEVNREKFPEGLEEAADYIRSKGMIPGLWFELEAVGNKSVHFANVDHLVKKDGVPLTVGERRFWDMEDPWVIEYLSKKVIGLLKRCGFGYIKIDYNDSMGIGCDGGDSLGEGLYRKIMASKRFFERIREEIPDIVIENCSSGGHRLEPSMMRLVSQASFSDAHETTAIPIIAANLHYVIKPCQSQIWAVLRSEDSEERIFYSLAATFLGRMCLSGDIYDLNTRQWELVEEGLNFYRKAADIIQNGTTVKRICTTVSYNHPQGDQIVIREWKNRGLLIWHRFENSGKVCPEFPEGSRIIAEYGNVEKDFSAKAWIYER